MKQTLAILALLLLMSCGNVTNGCPCIILAIDQGEEIRSDNKLVLISKRNASVTLKDSDGNIVTISEPDPLANTIIHSLKIGDTLK